MTETTLMTIIGGLLTISVRLTGMMLFAPFFGSSAIPVRFKAGVVIALTLLLYPAVGRGMPVHPLSEWPLIVISECLIGVGMGLATNVVFEGVLLAGSLLSVQMGYSLANILDPQTQVDTTVVPLFYQSIVMLLFLGMDVHYWILRAISKSFVYMPAGTTHLNALFTISVLAIGGRLFELGVQIAAPVLSATLVADIVLGLLGKAATQVPIMLIGPAIKSLLGFAILIATLKYWPDLFHNLFLASLKKGERLLHLAH